MSAIEDVRHAAPIAMLGVRGAVRELAHPEPVAAARTVGGVRFSRNGLVTNVAAFPEGLKHQVRLKPGETLDRGNGEVHDVIGEGEIQVRRSPNAP